MVDSLSELEARRLHTVGRELARRARLPTVPIAEPGGMWAPSAVGACLSVPLIDAMLPKLERELGISTADPTDPAAPCATCGRPTRQHDLGVASGVPRCGDCRR